MKITNGLTVVLLAIGLGACIIAPKRLDHVPLAWKPTTEIKLPPQTPNGLLSTKVQIGSFKDVRQQPDLIAENRENPTVKPVTTSDNVGDFVAARVRTVLDGMGLATVDNGGDLILSGEVRQFFVEETTTYKGRVELHIDAHNRAGKEVWNGTVTGESSRFGRSYSAANYYETFSDSLINAVSAMVEDRDFQAALTRK